MTSDKEGVLGPERTFARSILPWVVLAGGLVLYIATLNHWVTVSSVGHYARAAGFEWRPPFTEPLAFIVARLAGFLPAHWQPLSLNLFSAVCAALTLALLARSVALLPQDRTRDQRLRQQDEFGLLKLRAAWLPVVIAVLAGGLEVTFWQNATVFTGEMLNLLLFAYIVRCLLEYRVSERNSWLYRLALVYGLATANNWAMILFFPLALVAVIWNKGSDFLNTRFFLKMTGAGLAGLLLYLLLPIAAQQYNLETLTFWGALKASLGQQKQMIAMFRAFQWPFMILAVFSLLPLLLVSISWASSTGDVNPLSNLLGGWIFKLAHLGYFVTCLVVLYGPDFLRQQFEQAGLQFLTLRYLAALCVGYFAGYLLLVFSVPPARSWVRPGPFERALGYLAVAAVWFSLAAVPVGFLVRNLPEIKAANGAALRDYARRLAQSLPESGCLVLSDEPVRLWLLAAHYGQNRTAMPHIPINTAALSYAIYHRHLARQYPAVWQALPPSKDGKPVPEPIAPLYLIQRMLLAAKSHPIYYAHPSFGYYFEFFQALPHGLAFEMRSRPLPQFQLTAYDAGVLRQNLEFWAQARPELDDLLARQRFRQLDLQFLRQVYSRQLNHWGVILQQQGRLPEANNAFLLAHRLNPDNVVASINLGYNAQLRSSAAPARATEREIERKLAAYRTWDSILNANGPFDEPAYNFFLGQLMLRNNLFHQAAQQFLRVRQLLPDSLEADLMLGETWLRAGQPDQVLEWVSNLRATKTDRWASLSNRLELVRLEALAFYAKTNPARAEATLRQCIQAEPGQEAALMVATHVYLAQGLFTNALDTIEAHLRINPDHPVALLNKSVVLMQFKQHAEAIAALNRLLAKQPENYPARMNRAIAHLQSGQWEEARRDYEQLRQVFPNLFAVHYGLGEIAWQKKDWRAARHHYENYLKYAPSGTAERERVAARFAELKKK